MKLRRIALTAATICLLAACGAEEAVEDLGTWIGGKGYTG
jgi:hypothetical protein